MYRVAVIANPVASQFTGGSHRDVMSTLSKTAETEAIWPASPTEATAAARSAAEAGVDVIVAMGGDGMVHHVTQGIVGSGSALGIIPAGTTNVVARLLGVPSRPARAARLIARRLPTRPIGLARITLGRGAVESVHHAVFACGAGLDAEVVVHADADPYRKYRFGSLHYARSAVTVGLTSFPRRVPHVEVRADERETLASTVLVQFRSVYTYFGKIPLRLAGDHPHPMTVLAMETLKRRRVPQIALDAITGRDLAAVEGIEVWEGIEKLTLEASPAVAFQADGESMGLIDRASIAWAPNALSVVTGDS